MRGTLGTLDDAAYRHISLSSWATSNVGKPVSNYKSVVSIFDGSALFILSAHHQ